eukprot:CAMPEP_0183374446 /NCGR_PEP_ID=MMETSP0164_2-20130417/114514_1 /TAXON_ID=221442 /ORGANISM="Coccolithus pelagicus ssp braarudi, Strain PLY182g" /LENGTH=84 /DNA_ID=CAMNT_0025551481 /DNA_START=247 /DNA_END=501 /DNA_ORIENTATION=+
MSTLSPAVRTSEVSQTKRFVRLSASANQRRGGDEGNGSMAATTIMARRYRSSAQRIYMPPFSGDDEPSNPHLAAMTVVKGVWLI